MRKENTTLRKQSSTNLANEKYLNDRCVLNKLLTLIASRWSSEILLLIQHGTNRFSELKEGLEGISDNVLSDRLNGLVEAGLLQKEIFREVPLRVEYGLTETGAELMVHLHRLCDWAKLRFNDCQG
jgi:DNA-binding HxlR family transcriptional regulator